MNQEERELQAREKYLGPGTSSGQLYDIIRMMDALFHCKNSEIFNRAIRVARHALVPIQEKLQTETELRYFKEAYGLVEKVPTNESSASERN